MVETVCNLYRSPRPFEMSDCCKPFQLVYRHLVIGKPITYGLKTKYREITSFSQKIRKLLLEIEKKESKKLKFPKIARIDEPEASVESELAKTEKLTNFI